MSDTLRSTDFDDYLERLHGSAPETEITAAIAVYERLRTAVVISGTVMGKDVAPEFIATVFDQLCVESRALRAPLDFSLPDEM